MRKFVVLLLSLVFLFAAVPDLSSAEMDYYFGTWISASYVGGTYFLTMYQLFEDGTGYYISRDVENNTINKYNECMITWERTSDGIILTLPVGKYQLYNYADGWMKDGSSMLPEYYHKTFPVSIPNSNSNSNKTSSIYSSLPLNQGTIVEPGRYIVGIDIPAGSYRLEVIDNQESDIYVYSDASAKIHSSFCIISKFTPTYAKLSLEDGQMIRVDMGPVFFTRPTSLDFDWVNNND